MTIDEALNLAPLFWDAACALPPGPARAWVYRMPFDDEIGAALVARAEEQFGELSEEAVTRQIELEAAAWALRVDSGWRG